MPNKKYTMLLDGEERQVSIDKFEKYGPSMYAERFSGASIRMRNDKGEDYAVPVNDYQRALDSGFRPYVTSYYKDKKEELESHDESVADSVVYLSDSPDPNKPIHVEIPESIRTQYGFTPEETGPNEQALPDNIRQKADDESLFEENRRRFAEGKPLKGVTTQSIIDANPELGLKRTKQYSEEVLQRSRENVPDYFKSKKDMSLMDLPLGVPGDMLSDEGFNARIDAASKYYQSDSFKDRVKKETGERVEDLYSQTRADLKSIEERISNRESALRNENWRPGMPSTRDDGNLAELRGQRTILSTAENILEDSRKIVEEAGKKDSPWYAALGRGVKDKVFDVDAWTMGISDMAGSMNLNKTLEKADKGEGLTSAEQRLLDAAVTNMAVNAYYSSDLSAAYKAGQVTGESIPFMLEMAVNPISASGNATAKLLLKYGMKKFGREMAKNVGKTAAAAAGMTATTGLPGVIGGAYDRVNGQVQFGLDDKGKLVYTGRKGGMGAGEAFAKSAASRFLENHSEMVFNAFKGMGDEVWRGVQKVVPEGVDGFIQKAAQTGAGRMIREYGNNELMKEAAKRTQFHGILGEYLEEVYNNLANVPLGEMTMDQVLDLDRNIETFLGLAPTSVFFGVLGLGGMAAERAKHRLKMNAAFGSMTKVQRDKLAELERLSKMNGNADIRTFIKETMADPDLSKEQKRQEIEYTYDIAVGNAYDEAADEQVRIQEEARSAAQEDGQSVYASGDTAAIRESVVREDVSRSRLEEVLPDAAAIDALLEADDVARAEMLDGLPEEIQERAKDLLRDHDRRQAVEDAIDEAHLPEFEEAEARVQEMTRNGRVTIIPLGRFGDPKHSFGVVINGLDESGNVTTNGGLVMVVPLTNGANGPDFSSFDSRRAEAITLDSSMERQEMEPDSVIESLLGSYKEDVDKLSQPPIVPGQTYTILDGYGKPVGMQVQGRDEQGNWLVLMEGQKIPLVMPEDTILEMLADAERASVIAEYEADDAAKAKGKAAARESLMGDSFSPEVMALKPQVNEEIKIGGIRAQISEVGPDGITVRYIADNGTVSGAGQIPMEEYYAYKQSLFDSQKDQARKDAAAPDLRKESSSVQAEKKDDYKQGSNRDFVSMGMEKAERILGDIYGEKMPRKVAVTAKAYADDVVKAQKAVEKAQEAYDNAPIGREGKAKETLDKAKANYEAVKNEADFWAEMDADIKAAQAEREAMLNPQVDVDMSEQPMTVDEFVAQQLANGNITLTSESFKKETDFGEKERKKFPKMFRKAENGGMTIERAGERLMEIASEEGLSFFGQDDANAGRDALINFLGSVYSWGDVAGYVRNSREAMAKRESDAIRDEMEAFIWNNFHMTPEEYATQREIEAVENPYGNVDLAAIDAIFAEKEFESQTLNEETNESGRITEGNQGESGILSEEQVGDNGGNQPSEEERETEGTGNGTQDESEAAQAVELTQKEGESVLDFAERVAEENRRRPLRERANEWSKSLGVKAIFLESIDEVDARTRATIEASHVEGAAVPGWVAKNGEVFFFMPDLRDMKDIDETYIHEVVAHIGMERLLGKERFAELCDKVWDMMPQAEKNYYFYQYPGVKEIKNAGERKRRAADEYIAHLAEKQNLTPEEKTIWDNIVKAVRELLDKALNKILSKSRITDADIESLIRASYANMKKDARADVSQKLEQARSEVNQKPTEKQKEAGNYKKGHIRIDGFDVTIENPKGSVRSGTDKGGKKWSILMNNDYGYICGTEAVDGDHIDVFLSDSPIEGNVFVVDQKNEDGSFDESKVMYGFSSLEEARAAYLSNYKKGWESRIMAITEVSKKEFKKWIDSSHRKTKAFSEYKNIKTAPSIEETNVSRMADIEARILEIEGRRNEISDELAETPDYDALKVAELRTEEWELDQEQSELEAEYSGLRSMNDESNAILENEGNDLRFSAKKKRALETVSTSRKKHQQTVISSADGAKILNNLDNLAEKYENDTHTKEKTFIGEVAKAIEARKQGSGSQYATFETVNGNVVTIRLSDHNATVSNFDNRGENEGISIVVSAKDNNGITNDGTAHIVEYFYDSIDLRRADGKPLAEIVKSIKQSLYSGEFKDTTGLAERQEVNESRFRVVKDKNGKKSLVGLHNISESKLKKAIKQGGLANPSMAVIDLDKQSHVDYGDITLIAPSSLIDKKSGKNIGTYTADAWTPIYPNIEKRMSDKGAKIYSKSLESVPSELRNKVRLYFNAYLEDGNTSGALNYWFLHDTGKNPPSLTSQSNDYTNEELDAIEAISNAGYYFGLNEEEKQKVLDLFIEKQGGKDAFDAKIAERIETMKNNLQRPDLKAFMKNKVEQKLQEIQEYGYDYEQVSNFYSNAQRAINNRGKIDEFRTFRNAQDIVNNEGLQVEFNEWLADKEEQFGVEEYLFVGYNNNGDRKYLPNALENASKLMKKEGRAGATGLHGFNHFVATLAPNAGTLAQINKKKGNLSTQEEYDAFREKWGDVYHELAKQLQPDATGYADYGYYRLEEMPTVKNPKEYVKKEYGIELSDEFMKKYNEFVSAIKNDFPARYFETKFERPVYLNEFAAAVVPQGTSKDVVDALTEAGLPVEEYESGNNEARMAAVDKVSSEMEGVRFRFIGEKGAANLDKAEEATTRLDNLAVAREMESAEKDAKTIKMATGWERGADGLWRYETMDSETAIKDGDEAEIRKQIEDIEEEEKAYKKKARAEGIDADEREKAYVDFYRRRSFLEAQLAYVLAKKADVLTHTSTRLYNVLVEGDVDNLFDAYPQLATVRVGFATELVGKALGATVINGSKIEAIDLDVKKSTPEELNGYLAHEIQHAIQEIEGFAPGGNPSMESPAKVLQKEKNISFMQNKLNKSIADRDALIKERDMINNKMSQWWNSHENATREEMLSDKEMQEYNREYDEISKKIDGADEKVKFNQRWLEATWQADTTLGYKRYKSLVGEVEARNVTSRIGMSLEQRRATLASETEDVAREAQIFLKDGIESGMRFRISEKGKQIQAEVDSFTSKYNSKPVVVIDSNMTDRELERLVGFEAKEVRDAIELGLNSGYNPNTDKIYIMTDNVKDSSDLEDSLFHENLHQYLLSDKSLVVEFFTDAEDAYKKNVEQIKKEGYKAYEVPEELFVRVVADSQVKGNFAKVFSFLSEEGKEKLTNLLKENGYDIARETEIRTSGRMDGSGRDGSGRRNGDDFGRVAEESSSVASPSKVEKNGRAREIRQLFDQVADNGLRGVVGDKAYDSAMFEMYRSLPMEAREKVAMDALNNHGADMGKAMDKFISESYDTSFWGIVVGVIRNMLRKKGYNIHFSENDIRYLVWRNRQKLNPYSIIDKAEDINKRVVLGTGDRSDKPDGIRFREKRPLIVRRYDEAVDNGSFRFQEAFQDSMLSLKVLMEIIEQETGKKAKTFENAYTAENRLSSVNKVDNEKYIEEFFTPLMSVIKRLSDKFGQKSVEDYIYAKSGLERNEVLKKRDADKAYAEALEDLDEKLRKGELSDDQYDALKSNAEIARSEAMSSEDDYAGLRGLLFNSKAHELDERLRKGEITEADYNRLYNELESKEDEVEKDFKSFAETIVNDFESSAGRKDVDDLWDKINAATNETLRKDYESGMIDKETYEATRDMMEYYVPLRGWSEKTAEEVYDYHHTTAPIQKNQKTAKGRRSQADNPITSIAQMAQNAIVRGNRNKMKQRLFNFVVNRPTALATFQEGWYVKNNASGDFELEYPVIEEGDTAEDIQKKMDEFERRMEELSKDRQAFKGKLPFGSPYRIQSKQKNEHIVPVMINGREYGIYINGNPRAAQAVNGMTNPEASNMLSEMYESAKRFYSAGLTSWNPDFLMANAVRDGIHSTVMTFLDKGPLASAYFLRDIPKCIKTIRAEIFGNGSSDPQMHQYFDEFVNFGGETGYTAVHTLEDYKKEYEKMLRNLEGLEKGAQFAKEGFSSIAKWMEQANRMFEDISRFNAYQSARKSGRSVEESVDAAKNITVNFNKKGALGTTKGFWGSLAWFMNKWILFFNPTVQGITQIYKSAKKNPKRFNVLLGTILGSGVLVPFLNSMVVGLLGGDEEDYWLQNDYNRMNNLLLKNPAGKGYFKVPLPPTFREIYGMGDIFYRLMTGRISPERASVATLRQLQLLTGFLNVIPDDEPDLGKALIGLAPDVLAPLTDIVVNQDFTGRKIAKITDYNKYSPEYQRVYKGVSPFYVEISRYINKIGGDDVSRAPLYGTFINPAYMEHIITGYTGGIGKTLSNVSGIVADAVSGNFDENFDLRKIPVASRFYSVSDESTVRSAVNRKFREYQSRFEKISYDYKKYSEAVRSGKTEFSVEIERMDNNGEKAFVDYFRKKQKSLNKKLDRLKNNPEDKTLEQEITDLKAEIALKCYELLK